MASLVDIFLFMGLGVFIGGAMLPPRLQDTMRGWLESAVKKRHGKNKNERGKIEW